MSGSAFGKVKAEPNLTPILDMVFQLITFFVLIFNCAQAETARGVDLPVIGSAQPPGELRPGTRVIVFNCKLEDVDPDAPPVRRSSRKPQIWVGGAWIHEEDLANTVAKMQKSSLQAQGITEDDIKNGEKLKDIIVVRADVEVPFGMVNKVITACQEKGYEQFAFKTKQPEKAVKA
jgi:biopolymer transport protein ExbD